jgi:hypothetical protein
VEHSGSGTAARPQILVYTANILRLQLIAVKSSVGCDERLQLLRHVIGRLNRVRGAYRHACSAIDTSSGIYVQLLNGLERRLILLGMNAVGGTDIHAQKILDASAGNYVSHGGKTLAW